MRPPEIGTEFDFGGVKERIVTRDDFSLDRARQVLIDEVIAIIGYGVQGPAQALNLKDNGFRVVVGQREGATFDKAVADGFRPGVDLFPIDEAIRRGTQIQYLLSDAGQTELWTTVSKDLQPDNTLYYSHGFSHVFRHLTGINPPPDIDVILVAPKGAGRSVRQLFLAGRGINSSFAVGQDRSGKALERALATGMGIGSGFLFPTTFENEVHSDLTGERGVLLGEIKGQTQAGYDILREMGISPEEAFLHTTEITTQTIARIIGEIGGDGLARQIPDNLVGHFSAGFAAARGALEGIFEELYESVISGTETARVLEANSKPDYREGLNDELQAIDQSEMERVGGIVRGKRPIAPSSIQSPYDALAAGVLMGAFHTQYELFIRHGHTPSEAFNETVEESTQSLYPMIDERGFPWMYSNCSTTAQRGALDWNIRFRDALIGPLRSVYQGSLDSYPQDVRDYITSSSMWKVGLQVRNLRPENQRIV